MRIVLNEDCDVHLIWLGCECDVLSVLRSPGSMNVGGVNVIGDEGVLRFSSVRSKCLEEEYAWTLFSAGAYAEVTWAYLIVEMILHLS
jgi:hypothetical protein